MRKNFGLGALTLLFFSALSADKIETQVSVLKSQMAECSTRTVHGNFGGKTAPASPPIRGENWFFNGEMLWWHADEGGTDYAQNFQTFPGTAAENNVRNRRLTFKWDFGFRAGIGTTFDHDKWDLFLNFTWFRANNSSASSLHGSEFLTPLITQPPVFASQVKAHWNLHFYVLDLTLGRHSFLSPQLALHPYAGIKNAWIPQHIRSSSKLISNSERVRTKQRNEFWGIGPELGISGKWFLGSGFNLFALGGGSFLWGEFTIRHHTRSEFSFALNQDLKLDTHLVVPMAEFQLGIGYETNLYHGKYRLEVSTRYENQYWWSQNQLPYFSSLPSGRFQRYCEDLSLQGITLDVRFDF
jgi:hypothetical protein